ncbi:hypothetical protein cyc_07513 [Cyclospora cayetanensis]|uniref:Uncharacterized protein n=1 Tax=Cyclospora cayetanensis TaxID=88456 RepID=A0A1D3CUP4_9EIME|nr:hypothetical protein cyc_07513 [Cyclospora cayetanensis]
MGAEIHRRSHGPGDTEAGAASASLTSSTGSQASLYHSGIDEEPDCKVFTLQRRGGSLLNPPWDSSTYYRQLNRLSLPMLDLKGLTSKEIKYLAQARSILRGYLNQRVYLANIICKNIEQRESLVKELARRETRSEPLAVFRPKKTKPVDSLQDLDLRITQARSKLEEVHRNLQRTAPGAYQRVLAMRLIAKKIDLGTPISEKAATALSISHTTLRGLSQHTWVIQNSEEESILQLAVVLLARLKSVNGKLSHLLGEIDFQDFEAQALKDGVKQAEALCRKAGRFILPLRNSRLPLRPPNLLRHIETAIHCLQLTITQSCRYLTDVGGGEGGVSCSNLGTTAAGSVPAEHNER